MPETVTITKPLSARGSKAYIFKDKRIRNDKGQFSSHGDEVHGAPLEAIKSHTFTLGSGRYTIGSVTIYTDSKKFGLSAEISGGIAHTQTVNKHLGDLNIAVGFSSAVTKRMINALKLVHKNLDITKVILKRIDYENPAAEFSLIQGITDSSRSAGVQLAAVKFVLDTPIGEIDIKLKAGANIGTKIKTTTTKKGAPGTIKEMSGSCGIFEVNLIPRVNPTAPIPKTTQKILTTASQEKERAQKVITKIESKPTAVAVPKRKIHKKRIIHKKNTISDANQEKQEILFSSEKEILDATVDSMMSAFNSDNLIAKEHYQNYRNAQDKEEAFNRFNHEISAKSRTSEEIETLLQAGTRATFFLTQLANLSKNVQIHNFATSINAVVQTVSGAREFAQGVSLMQAATSGVDIATAGMTLMGGAGAVLAGVSLISSLMSDSDNGSDINEMMASMHTLINNMWEDVRERFEYTHRLQVHTLRLIAESHEELVHLIEHTNNVIIATRVEILEAVEQSHQSIINDISYSYTQFKTYLEYIVDADARKTLQEISKIEPDELSKSLRTHSIALVTWLTRTAALPARSGLLPKMHNKLSIDQAKRVQLLEEILAPEKEKFDVPLGFYFSLIDDMNVTFATQWQADKFINPKDWFEVFETYLLVMRNGKKAISNSSDAIKQAYFNDIDQIDLILSQAITFLTSIAQSSIWEKLVDRISKPLDKILTYIETAERDINKPDLPQEWRFSLSQSGPEIMAKLDSLPNNHEMSRNKIGNMNWVGAPTIRRQDYYLGDEFTGGDSPYIPHGDLGLYMDQDKINLLAKHGHIASKFDEIRSNIKLAFALSYQFAGASNVYFTRYVSEPPYTGRLSFTTAYFCPSVTIGGQAYPFAQGNFFRESVFYYNTGVQGAREGWYLSNKFNHFTRQRFDSAIDQYQTNFYNINEYTLESSYSIYSHTATPPTRWSHVITREDFNQHQHVFGEVFENAILIPARKKIVNDALRLFFESEKETFTNLLQYTYEAMTFIKLIDTCFQPVLNFEELANVPESFTALKNSGSSGDFDNLRHAIRVAKSTVLNSYLQNSHLGIRDFTNKIQINFELNPLRQKLLAAKADLRSLKAEIGPMTYKAGIKHLRNLLKHANDQYNSLYATIKVLRDAMRALQNIDQVISPQIKASLVNVSEHFSDITLDLEQYNETDTVSPVNFSAQPVKSSTHKTHDLYSGKNPLTALCANPSIKITELKKFLKVMDLKNKLNPLLNVEKLIDNALHWAIKMKHVQAFITLLEHDAKIYPSIMAQVGTLTSKDELFYLFSSYLHFYHYLQMQSLENHFPMGRTLSLVRESIASLSNYTNLFSGDVINGKTGDGKSFLASWLSGVNYVLGPKGRSLIVAEGSIPETAKTSNSTVSETIYPQIIPFMDDNGKHYSVDMPGYQDIRGLPWEIAGGLSAHMLGRSFKNIRSLILVCTYSDLFDTRMVNIRESFDLVSRIINKNPTLMQQLMLVVNKAPSNDENLSEIKDRIQMLLEQDPDILKETEFLLREITNDQIIVIHRPTSELREKFFAKLKRLTPQPVHLFNFSSFHLKVEEFKTLLLRLASYYGKAKRESESLKGSIKTSHRHLILQQIDSLTKTPFLENRKLTLHADLQEDNNSIENLLASQSDLKTQILKIFEDLNKNYFNVTRSTFIPQTEYYEEYLERKMRLKVVGNFFYQLNPLIKYLNLKGFEHIETSDKVLLTEKNGVADVESDHENTEEYEVNPYFNPLSPALFVKPFAAENPHYLNEMVIGKKNDFQPFSALPGYTISPWMNGIQCLGGTFSASVFGWRVANHNILHSLNSTCEEPLDKMNSEKLSEEKIVYCDNKDFSTESPISLKGPTSYEYGQVAVPLVNKFCQYYGLFGHKKIPKANALKLKSYYEAQLSQILEKLDALLRSQSFITRDYQLAYDAFTEAKIFFQSTFSYAGKKIYNPTVSDEKQMQKLINKLHTMLDFSESNLVKIKTCQYFLFNRMASEVSKNAKVFSHAVKFRMFNTF